MVRLRLLFPMNAEFIKNTFGNSAIVTTIRHVFVHHVPNTKIIKNLSNRATGATGATGACHHAPSNLTIRPVKRERRKAEPHGGSVVLAPVLPNFNCPKFQLQGIKISVEIHS